MAAVGLTRKKWPSRVGYSQKTPVSPMTVMIANSPRVVMTAMSSPAVSMLPPRQANITGTMMPSTTAVSITPASHCPCANRSTANGAMANTAQAPNTVMMLRRKSARRRSSSGAKWGGMGFRVSSHRA